MNGKIIKSEEDSAETSPSALVALALNNGADAATLSRMMDLQERWDAKNARKAFVEAMTGFKRDVPNVLDKDASVDFTSPKGRTHYKHATLGGIISKITGAMSKHGLSASWETKQDGKIITVTCHVAHSEGHVEDVTLSGPPDESGNKNPIQQIGSTVTYLQRYTLLAALGLATAGQDEADGSPEERPPVTMPKEEPAGETSIDANVVTGEIEEVSTKTGENKKGVWTRWGIKVNGEWYGTFSETIGEMADNAPEGRAVRIEYETDDKGRHTITDMSFSE